MIGPAIGLCGMLAALFIFISSCYFLAAHRDTMIQLYRGKGNAKLARPSAYTAILATLRFCGSQVRLSPWHFDLD
jgi:hypothetical protein